MIRIDTFLSWQGHKVKPKTDVLCDTCGDTFHYKEGRIGKDEETTELVFKCDDCLEIENNLILNYMEMKGRA